jgi:hypothetical protein
MTQKRMELWANENLSEFGIKFDSDLVVKTSNDANISRMIDNALFKSGYDLDWHYTLSEWVVYYLANKYLANKYTALPDSRASKQKDHRIQTDKDSKVDNYLSTHLHNVKLKGKLKTVPKRGLKCHYCNLKYCMEEERKEHEGFWHGDKLIKH